MNHLKPYFLLRFRAGAKDHEVDEAEEVEDKGEELCSKDLMFYFTPVFVEKTADHLGLEYSEIFILI